MWHKIWHIVLESLHTLPILFLAYVVIELIEVKASKKLTNGKFLKSGFAPVIGAGVGLIPQCGFSVIATDLYTKRKITVSTLLAMYIATSDEAIPTLLLYPDKYTDLLIILAIKFVLAVIVGYGSMLFFKYIYKQKQEFVGILKYNNVKNGKLEQASEHVEHNYFVGQIEAEQPHVGCCGHSLEENHEHKFWEFIYHPILHSLKIFAFILIVNIVFGLVVYFVGEPTLMQALNSTKWFQPIIAGLIGLIPNCAASVVITRLFAMGGLTLGACISGLVANAGLGLALLIKQNTNKKHTFFIILSLYLISVVSGLIITLF